MARKYRKVYQHTWVDEKFSRLDAAEKLIALYALTGPASNRIGIFPFSLALAAEQTGLDNVTPNVPGTLPPTLGGTFEGGSPAAPQTFRERFDNVCRCLGWKWDATAKVLFIPSWWKHNRPENPNVLRSALDDADELPQTALLKEFWANAQHLPDNLASVLSERSGNVTPNVPGTLPPTLGGTYATSVTVTGAVTGAGKEDSSEPDKPASDPAPNNTSDGKQNTAPAETPLLVFPVVGNAKAKSWPLLRAKVAELQEAFPSLDVLGECRRALQWVNENPAKKKTPRGMGKFLFGWMSRAQNAGHWTTKALAPVPARSSADATPAILDTLI